MKHHTVTLTSVEVDAIKRGHRVRLDSDHGLLTIGNAPAPGVVRLWQVELYRLTCGDAVEVDAPDLRARFTFQPVTESLMGATR
ncbi:hypothetical protein [Paractinoplanes toevensis]|uniref:Uncharacterized protein n=1 Tax=Paractinoplanes toevensis TaxID=571911 RepID=A0A919T766_9ACTN|nr:hypothetical protein [Actinoplanes toevensis]GIM88826.1 hypothetical protein Ato02nite_006190 [Actinoplanes toevensis]